MIELELVEFVLETAEHTCSAAVDQGSEQWRRRSRAQTGKVNLLESQFAALRLER